MAIIWAIGAAIVAVGYSYQQAKKAQREAKKQADAMAGVLITKDSTIESVPVIYGERRVGGTRVFIETKNGSEGKHEYLYMAIVLSEGEVEEIDLDTIHFDDKPLAQYGLYPPVNDVFDRYTNEDLGRLAGDGVKVYDSRDANKEMFRVEGFIGTDFQAASTILTEAPSWTADHRLQGVAYLAIRLKWDEDVFSGVPSVSVVVRGKKVYDARKDSTSSYYNASLGVSSHRSNDVATWEYSNNPALCLRDYLTNARYGKALPESSINDDYFYSAADDIDSFEVTPYSGGSNIKLFQLNAVIDTAEEIFKNVERILIATRGFFPFSNGKYGLTIDQAKSSVLTINSDIIIGGIKVKGPQKEDRFNIVEIKYPNKNLNYNVDTAIWPDPQSDLKTSFSDGQGDYLTEAELYAQFVEEDNGFELKDDVDLEYVTNYYAARDMARIFCLRSRYNMAVEVQCSSKAIDLMIGDVVSVEHPTVGWSAGNGKLFQVEGVTLREDGTVDLLLLEYTSSIYAYDPANEEVAYVDSDLPDPFLISAPTNVGATSQSALLEDGTLLPRLGVTWTASEDKFVSTYEVGYKLTGTTEYSIVKSTGGSALIEGIKTGTYDVAVRSVNSMGIKSAWVTKATSTDISADTTAPDAPTSVTATGGVKSIELTWDNPEGVDNADFKHVEIYYTTDTNFTPTNWTPQDDGTASLAKVDGESFILGGLTAGDQYKFWLRSVDFTGNKSAYASRAEAVGTAIATPAGDIDVSNINTSDLNNDAGFVDADGAAAAAPVQSVAGLTGSVLVADIITEGALIVSGDNISDLTNDAGYTTFDANDVEAAIANNVTVIDGAKITTGTVATARLDVSDILTVGAPQIRDDQFSAYQQFDFIDGADGFTTGQITSVHNSDGTLTLTSTGADPTFNKNGLSIDGSKYDTVRVRIKRTAGTGWQGTLYYSTSGHGSSESYRQIVSDTTVLNEWVILEYDMRNLNAGGDDWVTNTITGIRFDWGSGTPDDVFVVDYVAIGKKGATSITEGFLGGITIKPSKLYSGAGNWNNADTGFYLDNTGKFSLDEKLSFDPSSDTLRVDGLIEAVNLTVTGEAKFANVTADNVKVGSITYDMLSGEVKNAFQADIAVSTGGTVGDFQEDSGIIPSTVDLPVFSHGSKPVEITLTASKTGYHYVDYTTAQRTATYTVQRATDAAFTANLQNIGTGSIIVSAYDISGYYGGSSTVFYHAVNFSVLITDDPSLGDYYYRVTFSAGSAFSDSNIQVTANLAANEAASGVVSSGGNADTLDNLDSTKFMRTDEDTSTSGNLTVGGDLIVNGTTTTLNTATLDVEDKNITLNYGAGDTSASANGAGITIQDAVSSGNDASITWDATNDRFTFSHSVEFDGTPTTTNQQRGIYWTGWDKEGVTDFSDNAYIIHTDNTGGHAGAVLLISSQNDSSDGIAFATHASSRLKHNSYNIWTEKELTTTNKSNYDSAYTATNAATNANTASTIVKRDASGDFSAGTITASLNGNATSSSLMYRRDNRIISPSEDSSGYMRFGFTSWNNNNGAPYADYLHMRSYTDSSGGSDNLVMFKKDGIGMRIWQQTWGSSTAYSNYEDVWHTGNLTPSDYLPLTGGTLTGTATFTNNGTAIVMDGGSSAEGIKMTADSTTTYPVFLRSTAAYNGETSPWIYKENNTAWGIWHNNPINSIDFTRGATTGNRIADDVGGGDNSVTIRLDMANGYVQAAGGFQIDSTTVIDASRNLTNIGTISSGAFTTISAASSGAEGGEINLLGTSTYSNDINLDHFNGLFRVHSGGSEWMRVSTDGIDARSGGFKINGTTVIDSSRNLTNIGTGGFGGNVTLTNSQLIVTNTASGRTSTIGMDDNYNFYIKNTPLGNLYIGNGTTTYVNGNISTASNYKVNGTTVIDSSRNLTNIGLLNGYNPVTNYASKYVHSFYVSGNAAYFYRVRIATDSYDKIRIYRRYNWTIGGSSSYWNGGSTTHFGALNLVIDTLRNDWGGHRSAAHGYVSHNYTTVCGDVQIGQNSENGWVYVFLRAGAGGDGALYNIEIEGRHASSSEVVVESTYITSPHEQFNYSYANWHFDRYGHTGFKHNAYNRYELNSTTVIDSSRNLVNINNITHTGNMYWNGHIYWGASKNIYVQSGECSFDVTAGALWHVWDASASTQMIYAMAGSQVEIGKAGTRGLKVWGALTATSDVTAFSDQRLKSDVKTLDGKKVLKMRGVSFTKDGKLGSGVIAQELEKVAPELVHTADDEMGTKSVAYGNLVGYLIECVKEQQSEIEELKALVKQLLEK